MIETVLSGIVLGFVSLVILGLLSAAWLELNSR